MKKKKSTVDGEEAGYTANLRFWCISWVVGACPSVPVCFGPNKNQPVAGDSFVIFLLTLVVVRFGCHQRRCCTQIWMLVSKVVRNNSTVSGDRLV